MQSKEVVKDTEVRMKKALESTKREFNEVRTGRAHSGLIEGIHVDYFGTPTMIKELASVTIPDPRTVLIQPWDASAIPEIEKAFGKSNVGGTTTTDGKIVRLIIPALSEERRNELAKVVKEMAEKSRVSLRTIRRDANDKLKKMKADKTVTEDDEKRALEEIQKLTDRFIKDIDLLLEEKNKALVSLN